VHRVVFGHIWEHCQGVVLSSPLFNKDIRGNPPHSTHCLYLPPATLKSNKGFPSTLQGYRGVDHRVLRGGIKNEAHFRNFRLLAKVNIKYLWRCTKNAIKNVRKVSIAYLCAHWAESASKREKSYEILHRILSWLRNALTRYYNKQITFRLTFSYAFLRFNVKTFFIAGILNN